MQRLKIGRLFGGRGRIPMLLEKLHEIVSSVVRTGRRTIISAVIVEHEWRAKELSRETGGEINRLNRRRVKKKIFVLRYMNVSILMKGGQALLERYRRGS
jgi:precorrin-6B methylase 2